MSDRFKFRVWNAETLKWIMGAYLSDKLDLFQNYDKDYPTEIIPLVEDYYTIQQCTGLKDKNGKLIYEGDMVVVREDNTGIQRAGEIIWDSGRFCLDFHKKDDEVLELFYLEHYMHAFRPEVIGNIFENPELLED